MGKIRKGIAYLIDGNAIYVKCDGFDYALSNPRKNTEKTIKVGDTIVFAEFNDGTSYVLEVFG